MSVSFVDILCMYVVLGRDMASLHYDPNKEEHRHFEVQEDADTTEKKRYGTAGFVTKSTQSLTCSTLC